MAMITPIMLQEFFEHSRLLRQAGRTRFDIDCSCRWSFYFVDSDPATLAELGRHLEREGYEIMGCFALAPDEDEQECIYLRADRVETHTVASLHRRNHELYRIAEHYGVAEYDGMDVGTVDSA